MKNYVMGTGRKYENQGHWRVFGHRWPLNSLTALMVMIKMDEYDYKLDHKKAVRNA